MCGCGCCCDIISCGAFCSFDFRGRLYFGPPATAIAAVVVTIVLSVVFVSILETDTGIIVFADNDTPCTILHL